MQLTPEQIYLYATKAGFDPQAARTMVAIVMAESGGRTDAINDTPSTGDYSIGLSQINLLPSLKRPYTVAQMQDPLANLQAAYKLYSANKGFGDWTTFTRGNYKQYVNLADSAAKTVEGSANTPDGVESVFELPPAKGLDGTGVGSGPLPSPVAPSPGGTSYATGYSSEPPGLGAGASDDEITAYIRSYYGYASTYLDDPELGPILKQAAREGWDSSRLQGAVSSTTWWKNHSATARSWDQLKTSDPATATAQLEARKSDIGSQAGKLGIALDPQRLSDLAEMSLRSGWNTSQLQQAVASEAHYNPATPQLGDIGATITAVKKSARDYFIPVSDQSAFDYAQQIAAGKLDQAGVDTMFQQQALGRFPTIADQIKAGITPGQYFEPYKQLIAGELEKNPDDIDLVKDPRFNTVLDYADVGSDKRRTMTLSEVQRYTRSLPEWDTTNAAKTQAASLAESLTHTFGKVG